MPELTENIIDAERAVLVSVDTGAFDAETSLAELSELADAAGIETVAEIIQKRPDVDKATCVGSGKLEELSGYVKSLDASMILFDCELSATQLRNIEKACDTAVIDRTMLILEIFARRAQSREGKVQVELARNRYMLPRLSGLGKSLSRLGGGGGAAGAGARRGKGETMLELDRRHLRRRIQLLESQLEGLEKRRGEMRRRRRKDDVVTAAIVGYTNVGKSTLLNALTDAGVLAEDKLFATLDPTARALSLPMGRSVMLIDTVGLIRRLPHHLVEAFKSTLEEAVHADLLLNVCDASSNDAELQIKVTNDVLKSLGVMDTPVLTVLNKCDLIKEIAPVSGMNTVAVSAKTHFGFENLLHKIEELLPPAQRRMRLLVPYEQSGFIAEIRKSGKIFEEKYVENGTEIDALIDKKLVGKASAFTRPLA